MLHDFAYGDLVFDGRRPASFLAADGAREVGIELFSMSKSYGMAGWRLGFAVGNAEIVRRIELLQDHLFAGVFRPVQEAGHRRADRPAGVGRGAPRGLRAPARPRAAPCSPGSRRARRARSSSGSGCRTALSAERLLAEHGVAVAPGEGFGPSGAGYARISLAVTDEVLDEGLRRLGRADRG